MFLIFVNSKLFFISFIKEYTGSKVSEDSIKAIIIIGKRYTSDIMNNDDIKESYCSILPSNDRYSYEQKESIIILFKEMMKEGVIKKGGNGSEIIEEMLFILKEMEKKKDIIMIEEEMMKEADDFVLIAKEKGFKENLYKNKNNIIGEVILIDWKELCYEEVFYSNFL